MSAGCRLWVQLFAVLVQHVRDILELLHSKNCLKMLNLETSLLLLKIQTFITVHNFFFTLA